MAGEDDRWQVVELRQYTLRPGGREALIELFDRELVETQEAVGIRVIGQFRDEDDPDRFVWLRGFRDMPSRRAALTAFYDEGATWKAHGARANATMIDSSDVLLLRPVTAETGFSLMGDRPPPGAGAPPAARYLATIYYRDSPVDDEFVRFFERRVRPVMIETGAPPVACFRTEPAENNFPRLPVRDGVNVFVWFAAFPSAGRLRDHLDALARSPGPREVLSAPAARLRLAPTARSLVR